MDNLQLPREEYFFLDFEALYLQKVAVLLSSPKSEATDMG